VIHEPSTTWQKIARRIRVPVGFAFTVLYVWLAHPTGKSLAIGTVFVTAGIAVRALASGHLQKNERLATTGPYAYTRNPLYLGSLILALGFTIAARSFWVVAIMGIIFAAIYIPVIQAEEAFLRRRFPEFDAYAREVPRFVPRLASRGYFNQGFSWELYLKHREYNAALGSAALIAAIGAKVWLLHHGARATNSIF
jgi:protein-S-isoprenylcysteine O-methyltransferase Ste14